MLRPAPGGTLRRVLRAAGRGLLRTAAAIALFAILIAGGAWGIHGLILLIAAIP